MVSIHRLRLALLNRRFRTVVLVVAGVPVSVGYLWTTLIGPIINPYPGPVDFFEDYVGSARLLASGTDIYSACLTRACWKDLANTQSLYPPVVSWLSLPLVHLDQRVTGAVALVVAHLCVVAFIVLMARALRVRDWQVIALWVLAAISFTPLTSEVLSRNLQVLLLTLSAVWFAGWLAGDRWWAGVALGAGIALKLAQAPSLLVSAWFRRRWTTLAAVAAIAVLWAVGAPRYLVEYLFKVVPGLNQGTGFPMDVAPTGAVARLLHPGSIYGYGTGIDLTVRILGYAIAAVVIGLTALVLRAPRADREGRALEAALVVAATPLILAVVRPGHLLLLLLPMAVLGTAALRQANIGLGVAVGISWLLMGPVYLWMSNWLAEGVGAQFLRAGEETALLGAVVLWLAALQALRSHRSEAHISLPSVRSAPEAGRARIGSTYT